ncbi:MAG: prolipoprotein diacylglyceryl transferase [Candidatus Gracilibacteria bacterium]|nr:prolipoprotein diacylglyceryl transferase [Candidatus Gracilibacteria bacterium]
MTIFQIHIFGLTIAPSYYGLMYAIGFIAGYYYFLKKNIIKKQELENLFFYIFLGVVLGGRIGYILFYDLSSYINNPLNIIKIWQGGMSFHGGFLGVILATFIFSRNYKINFWKIIDELAVIVPIGLGAGRIGNYLNKELLGFTNYTGPLAIEKSGIYYFPSPLLESFLEGFLLLIILYFINKNKSFLGQTSVYFLIFYSLFRIFVESFFRTPDIQIGYIFGFLTMGEILSLPMLGLGMFLLFTLKKFDFDKK